MWERVEQHHKEKLAYYVNSSQNEEAPVLIGSNFRELVDSIDLSPTRQADLLIKALYHDKKTLFLYSFDGENDFLRFYVKIGSFESYHLIRLLDHLSEKNFLQKPNFVTYCLTIEGFQYYSQLLKGEANSNQAFMALQFNSLADDFYRNFIKPTVKELGFDLKDMRELNIAGLINAAMEAEIRQSKFMVADVTPDVSGQRNPNVYWEAGFAEGIGIPVFYTCQQNSSSQPFDTRNHYHILYDIDKGELAAKELKAAIYNTFPNEVILKD